MNIDKIAERWIISYVLLRTFSRFNLYLGMDPEDSKEAHRKNLEEEVKTGNIYISRKKWLDATRNFGTDICKQLKIRGNEDALNFLEKIAREGIITLDIDEEEEIKGLSITSKQLAVYKF